MFISYTENTTIV